MSSNSQIILEDDDESFVNKVVEQFESEQALNSTGFSKYLIKVIESIKSGGKFRDFCKLLERSVEIYMERISAIINKKQKHSDITTTVQLRNMDSDTKRNLRRNLKNKALTSIRAIASQVLNFLQDLVAGNYEQNNNFLQCLVLPNEEIDLENEVKAFAGWIKSNPTKMEQKSLTYDAVYLELVTNPNIGLLKQKEDICPLIEDFVGNGDSAPKELNSYLQEKRVQLSEPQRKHFQCLVDFVKKDMDFTPSEPSNITLESSEEKPKRVRKSVTTYISENLPRPRKNNKRKSLSETLDENGIDDSAVVDLIDDDEGSGKEISERNPKRMKSRQEESSSSQDRSNTRSSTNTKAGSSSESSDSRRQDREKTKAARSSQDRSNTRSSTNTKAGSSSESSDSRTSTKLAASTGEVVIEDHREDVEAGDMEVENAANSSESSSGLPTKLAASSVLSENLQSVITQITNSHLLEGEIIHFGLVFMQAMEKKHREAGFAGLFFKKLSILFNQQQAQPLQSAKSANSVSTVSSNQQQVQPPQYDLKRFLEKLGIISEKWCQETAFQSKFTVNSINGDNYRYYALLLVLSNFLHHPSDIDQQHPQLGLITTLFSNIFKDTKFEGTPVISIKSDAESELTEFQYSCTNLHHSNIYTREKYIEKVGEVLLEAISREPFEEYTSRCVYSLKIDGIGKPSSDYSLPLSYPVTINPQKKIVLRVAAAIYDPESTSQTAKDGRMVVAICKSSLYCGGFYTVTQVEGTYTTKLLPVKNASPAISRIARHGRTSYVLRELLFVQTFSQLYANVSNILEEEFVQGTMLRPATLRTVLSTPDYITTDFLESILELVRQKIQNKPNAERNIILPVLFFETILNNTAVMSLGDVENSEPPLRLSSYQWDVNSSVVHMLLSHPKEHYQYCTIVFQTKMIYFNDSLTTYTDGKDPGRSSVWESIMKFLNFVYEHLQVPFVETEWNKVVCVVPQQSEKIKVHCGVYSLVFLLLGVSKGLTDLSFQSLWLTTKEEQLLTFSHATIKAIKHLLCSALLRESDIFDICFLFVPENKWSDSRRAVYNTLVASYEKKTLPKGSLDVQSFTFFD